MTPFSLLDLSPITAGADAGQALRNSLDLARHAEAWGYQRYWLAEHHNMPGIASAATAVAIGHVAGGTTTIRVGAGGIMLPNHAPLVVAEQFGTLESLYPGRIELGLGRAPGTDQATMQALRRHLGGALDSFAEDVAEIIRYFRPASPDQRVRAVPGAGLEVPIWILGSSLYGAELAAAFGLPYAFASHFAPGYLDQAVALYRQRFRPSPRAERPKVMVGLNLFAADTDEEARALFTSHQQSFVSLRRGRPIPLPPPRPDFEQEMTPAERAMLEESLSCTVIGSPDRVKQGLADFIARTGADELILTGQIFDHQARLRSFEIAAGLLAEL